MYELQMPRRDDEALLIAKSLLSTLPGRWRIVEAETGQPVFWGFGLGAEVEET